ncbi:MAG: N-acetyltransferase [Spirochaeta sp.]|nr:N-acetyltransferase [Spirochaeta sp.]
MIHESAQVDPGAKIGDNAKIWNWVQIRENAEIGENTIISKSVYIDSGVRIGRNVKIQNNVSVYHGVSIEDGVFIGPHVCFTNDKYPRSINPDGTLKGDDDWRVSETVVKYGSSIGANSTILPGVTIGRFAMIGSGAIVTKDVPDNGLVVGAPGELIGYVCDCGIKLVKGQARGKLIVYKCQNCGREIESGEEL